MYRNQLSVAGFALQLIFSGTERLDAQSSTPMDNSRCQTILSRKEKTSTSGQTVFAPPTTEDVDAPWPRELDGGDEKIAIYQPQVEAGKERACALMRRFP